MEEKLVTYTGGKRPSSSDQLAAEPMRTEGTMPVPLMTEKRGKDTGRRQFFHHFFLINIQMQWKKITVWQ